MNIIPGDVTIGVNPVKFTGADIDADIGLD